MTLIVLHLLSSCIAAHPTVIAARHDNAAVGILFVLIKFGHIKIDMCLGRNCQEIVSIGLDIQMSSTALALERHLASTHYNYRTLLYFCDY
jgi:hypothetical protein